MELVNWGFVKMTSFFFRICFTFNILRGHMMLLICVFGVMQCVYAVRGKKMVLRKLKLAEYLK